LPQVANLSYNGDMPQEAYRTGRFPDHLFT
jgi:hypothetical protein